MRLLLILAPLLLLGCKPSGLPASPSQITYLVLDYDDFGPQVASFEHIGYGWWQWNSTGGGKPDSEYEIHVVVYRGVPLEKVQADYPVIPEKNQDYRYFAYEDALHFLDGLLSDPESRQLLGNTISETKEKIVTSFRASSH
jgi:hypothetical protein